MTWAKVDDHANEHRKQLAAGAEACWLWACGLMYANRQAARDGFIPDGALGMLYPFRAVSKLAATLIGVGLWHRVPGGYLIHEFTWWNQTREQRDGELARGRERAAKSYEAKQAKNQKSSPEENPKMASEESAVLQNSSGSTPTPLPLPVRNPPTPSVFAPQGLEPDISPDDLASFAPEPAKVRDKKPKKTLSGYPEGLAPLERQREKCAELRLDCAREFERFSAHHQAKGSVFADWQRAFDTWIGNAPGFQRGNQRVPQPKQPNGGTWKPNIERAE